MQQRNKLIVGFTTIVLSGTVAFGAIASASGSGDGGGRTHLTTEQKCDRVGEVETRAAEIQARTAERIPLLNERRAEAEANGDTNRVEHIDKRIARLEKVSARMTQRLAKVETWAASNCAA